MVIHRNIKLWGVRKSNLYLLLLFGLLSYQQLEASMSGAKPVDVKLENKAVKGKEAARETAAKKAQEQGRMARLRAEAARNDAAAGGGQAAAEPGAKAVEQLPIPKRNLVNGTADAVSFLVTKAAKGVNGLTFGYARTLIAEPVMKTWLQMRQLEVKPDKGIDLRNYSETDLVAKAPSDGEVGLMNQKIDIIVDSVVKMYDNGLSVQEIGTFVKNAVQLTLYSGVIGMGTGAGGAIGAARGAVTGGAKSIGNLWGGSSSKSSGVSIGSSHSGFTNGFMLGSMSGSGGGGASGDGAILAILAVPIIVTGVTAGFGVYGGVKGAVKSTPGGMRAGARYTSKALQSPSAAAKMMWNDAWKAPDSAPTAQASTPGVNASQAGQAAAAA